MWGWSRIRGGTGAGKRGVHYSLKDYTRKESCLVYKVRLKNFKRMTSMCFELYVRPRGREGRTGEGGGSGF